MTHTGKSGDTLAKIVGAHRINPAQLLDTDSQLWVHPKMIRVSDVLNIPNVKICPFVQPLQTHSPQLQTTVAQKSVDNFRLMKMK